MSDIEATKKKLEETASRLLRMWGLVRGSASAAPAAPAEVADGDISTEDLDGGLENVLLNRIIKGEQIEAVFPVYGAMKAGLIVYSPDFFHTSPPLPK